MNLAYKVQLEKKALKQLRKLDAINQRNIATFIDTHLQGTHAPRKQGKALTMMNLLFWPSQSHIEEKYINRLLI